jgi:MFS transporter, putative metabolite:H+ symporter
MAISVSAAARLDRLPMGPFHWRLLRLVSLGMFFDTFDNAMAAGILATLLRNGWSTLALNAHFISVTFMGLSVGACLAGVLGDRCGRRFAYQFNLLVFGSMCLAASLAPSMEWLIAIRGVIGIGLGAEYVTGYSMVSEFVPPARRGWALAFVNLIASAAGFVVSFISFLVIPVIGWRAMFAIGGVGALWVWHLRKTLPESPRWLEQVGRTEDAEALLRQIEAEAGMRDPLPVPPAETALVAASHVVPFSVLFTRPVIKRTILAMLVNIVCLAGSYSFTSWVPTFFVNQGMSVTRSLGFASAMAAGSIAGPAIGMLVSDRIGRRRGLIITALVCSVAGVIYPHLAPPLPLILCGFVLVAGMNLAIGFGLGAYTPELFPTAYRFRGNGLAQMTGRASVIASPYVVVALYNAYGIGGAVGAISALYFLLAVGLLLFGIETNRQSLEALDPEPAPAVTDPATPLREPVTR